MKKQFLILVVALGLTSQVKAQVGINATNTPPDPSAMLDVKSSDKGLLIPRMTTIQKNAMPNKVDGLVVYDTDMKQFSYWKDYGFVGMGYWQDFGNPPSFPTQWWNQGANANDIYNGNAGNIGIGIGAPTAKFHVNGSFKLSDGSQGLNKVLTSDANGLASWQTPTAGGNYWTLTGSQLNSTNTFFGLQGGSTITPTSGTGSDGTLNIYSPTTPVRISKYLTLDGNSIQARTYDPFLVPSITERNLLLNPFGGKVGIGTGSTAINSTLFVIKSAASNDGTAVFKGTTHFTHFHFGANEDTYIRGGKDNASVIINDIPGGNVGIGTAPAAKFHVKYGDSGITPYGIAGFESNIDAFINLMSPSAYQSGVLFGSPLGSTRGGVVYTNNNGGAFESLALRTGGNNNALVIDKYGNVAIGNFMPTNKLDVNGTARAKEVIVETGWADYVFEKNYQLKTIDELEAFVKQNKHLPNIPTASEIEKNGLKVGETNKAMMEKIEELALYIIQLKKEIDLLKAKQ